MRLIGKRMNLLVIWQVLLIALVSISAAAQTAQSTCSSIGRSSHGVSQTHTARASLYTNPVFDADFPDPTVMRASDGWYYAYGTQSVVGGRTINIQTARSQDLVHWQRLSDALPVKPVWASGTQKFWAPDVHQRGNLFYMYFSAEPDKKQSDKDGLCLGVATATKPEGPFTDSGKPLKCGESFVNIDPMAFDDPKTGKRLLYWGSGFQPLKVQELSADRLSFAPGSQFVELIRTLPEPSYQRLVEGSWVIERGGMYYIFYSGDNCCGDKAHYAVMVARAKSPFGPFQTYAEATGKAESVILVRNDRWLAPGHNSIITDAAGQDWIFYHAINTGNRTMGTMQKIEGDRDVRRVMLMDRIVYRNGWPQIETGTPSVTAQRAPVTQARRPLRTQHKPRKTSLSRQATH